MTDEEWLQVLESSSLPLYVHMVGGKGGCTFATVKCLLLLVSWQFFLRGFNFSCSWRHCIQISQIRVWSARNDATSDNWVLSIIKCPPVCLEGEWSANNPPSLVWMHSWSRRDVTGCITITIKPEILRILRHDNLGTVSVFIVDLNAEIRGGFTNLTSDYQKLRLEIGVGI